MNDLASLQSALTRLLQRPAPLAGDAEQAATAAAIAAGNDRLSPVDQVDVYREQFFLRHVGTLRDDFRSIEHAVGHSGFDALAKAYLAEHPPASFNLRDLGHAMARFLAEREPWSADPFLAELARVEWAFVDAFDGEDAPDLDLAALAAMPEDAWSTARVVLQPSIQRLQLRHPAHDYRIAVRKGDCPARPQARDVWLVVYRGPEVLHCLEVEPGAFALLEELARGAPLAEACERAAASSGAPLETFQSELGAWFQTWTRLGWISRVG